VRERADPWIAGAAVIPPSTVLSWCRSFWFDEAATLAAANRSEFDILRPLLNFDAVQTRRLSWTPPDGRDARWIGNGR
jgi:mannosyltransferase